MGEFAYDYVGLEAEIGARLPHSAAGPGGLSEVPAKGAVGGAREPEHGNHAKRESSSADEKGA